MDAPSPPRSRTIRASLAANSFRTGALLLVVAAAAFLLWMARHVLLIIFAGALLGVLLHSMSDWLERWARLPRIAALPLIMLAIAAAVGYVVWQTGPTLVDQIDEFVAALSRAVGRIGGELTSGDGELGVKEVLRQLPSPWGIASGATAVAGGILGAVASGLIILFLGLYLAASPMTYAGLAEKLAPKTRRDEVREMLHEAVYVLRHWMLGQLVAMAVLASLTYLGLLILGMPLALLLALFAGLANFIPYLGPILAAIPMLAVAAGEGWTLLLAVGCLYLVLQVLESYLLTPLIQSRAVHLPPAVVISNQLLMGVLFGIPGIVLATPLAAVATVPLKRLRGEEE